MKRKSGKYCQIERTNLAKSGLLHLFLALKDCDDIVNDNGDNVIVSYMYLIGVYLIGVL